MQRLTRLEVFFPAVPNVSDEIGEGKPDATTLEVNRHEVAGLWIQTQDIARPAAVRLAFADPENRASIGASVIECCYAASCTRLSSTMTKL
ncbi:MAG: hypothetical protein O2968_11950, partial [Acidobacteria bacterium]|nr:hypothetical protein [Acidobacteriota bacterium]